jgi:hypothetical protein
MLVPKEMKVQYSRGIEALSDEQLEQAIEAVKATLEARADEEAKVIEGMAETVALPAPTGEQPRRKRLEWPRIKPVGKQLHSRLPFRLKQIMLRDIACHDVISSQTL